MMFWSIMSVIFVLLVTGVIVWRPYLAQCFPTQVVRYNLPIRAVAGIALIHVVPIHTYVVFRVKGPIKGMIEEKVSRRWAKKHRLCWYREVEKAETKKESERGT